MRIAAAVFLVCLLSAGLAFAQTPTATVTGRILDPSNAVIPTAKVDVINLDTNVKYSGETNDEGLYVVPNLPPGPYRIEAGKQGFKTMVKPDVILHVQDVIAINFTLPVGSTSESVTVEGGAPLVNTQSAALGTVVERQQLENLPTNSRYYLNLAYLTPGVVANQATSMGESISVNGQRGFANSFSVDGVNNQVSFAMYNRTAIPQESIAEFRVLTHQVEPQYGQATGAFINVVTRTGANELHGSAYGFFRNAVFDAFNAYSKRFTTTKPDTHRNLVGGTIGGPLKKNQLFYFGSYEWAEDLQSSTISAPQEAGESVALGPKNNIYMGRVDYSSGNNTVSFRYDGQHNSSYTGPGGLYTKSTAYYTFFNTNNLAFNWNRAFSPHMFGEFRAQFSTSAAGGDPVTKSGTLVIRPSSVTGKLSTLPYDMPEKDGQFLYNLNITRGSHDLKFGANYLRVSNTGSNRNGGDGIYYFATDAPYDSANAATWPYAYYQRVGPSSWHVPDNVFAFFAQDKWSIKRDLVLTYGLRYDVESFFSLLPPQGTLLNYIPSTGAGRPVANDKNNVAPRVSLAYSPWREKTVFRGGFGLFYGRIPLNEVALVINNTLNTREGMIIYLLSPPDTIPYPTPPTTGAVPQSSSSLTLLDNHLRLPRTNQYTFGIQQQLAKSTALDMNFLRIEGHNLWTIVNRNAPDPVTLVRPNAGYRDIGTQSSIGHSWYTGLEISLKHATRRFSFTAAYSLAKNIDDVRGDPNAYATTCNQQIIAAGDDAIRCDRGLANNDVRNRLVANGSVNLPLRFVFSSILTYQSGLPYSATAGWDVNRDDYANDYAAEYSRNTLQTSGFFSWDVRLTKRFVFADRYSADLLFENFNVTNTANYTGYVGNVLSALFRKPTGASDPRRMQFGFRFSF